jgi:hypothetical protein
MDIKSEPTDADERRRKRSFSFRLPRCRRERCRAQRRAPRCRLSAWTDSPADADDVTLSRCPSSGAVDRNSPNVNQPGDEVEQTTDAGSNDAESFQPTPPPPPPPQQQQQQIKTEVVSPSASPPVAGRTVRLGERNVKSAPISQDTGTRRRSGCLVGMLRPDDRRLPSFRSRSFQWRRVPSASWSRSWRR